MPKGGIPDRWLAYSKLGTVIVGTPFIAFKVPLKETLCLNVEPQERFSPSSLMEQYPNLGLVIDLTFTTRYYAPAEFLARGVQHCKILCPGHGSAPSDKEVKRFTEVVESFLEERPSEEKLVGVHCTHGLNRTGYMICRYMIDRMGFSPERAVKAFEDARGHAIERTEYLESLGYTHLSDRPPKREKSNHRSSKHKTSGGIQEPPYYDYQQHETSRNKDRHIPPNYGWSRESERLGDPYQQDGRSANVHRGSYQQFQYDSRSGNVQRDSYHEYQYDSRSGNVQRDSQQYQSGSRSGIGQRGSHSGNVQGDSQSYQFDSRSGNGRRGSHSGNVQKDSQQLQYGSSSRNVHRDSYEQVASGYYQNNSDKYLERQQSGQRHQEYRRPNYNPNVSNGQQSGHDRYNSREGYNRDSSQQEETTTTQPSCWF